MHERSATPDYSISDSSTCSENQDDRDEPTTSDPWPDTDVPAMYHHNPWSFYCPLLSPSRHHSVLFELPINLKEPPKPHISTNACHWNNNHVRMPFSPKNLFPNKENTEVKPRWDVIQCALLRPIKDSYELEEAIFSYNIRRKKLYALHELFDSVFSEGESNQFFETILPKIVGLALQLPELIRTPIPLLKQGKPHAVSLSQLQISSLLANAFLCTFPWKKEYASYPGINFNRLYECKINGDPDVGHKLKCIIHYFRRVCAKVPVGVVTFERRHIPRSQFPRWHKIETNISSIKLNVSSNGTIENDGAGMLQVDFANSYIGGGVLGYGCVQEEIRFVICPELIISKLFTEKLASNEAILMIGAERYSNYTGYASTFEWSGNHDDYTPFDAYGRKRTSITAIDALLYYNPTLQFTPTKIIRELNKAYVGFFEMPPNNFAPLSPVATGNWGCGAFKGNLHLKALIQIMACVVANRDIVYYTFGDRKLQLDIFNIYSFFVENNVTIVQLWKYLDRFTEVQVSIKKLLPFIKQCHIDSINIKCEIKKYWKPDKPEQNKNIEKNEQKKKSSDNNLAVPSTSKQNLTVVENSNLEEYKIEELITDDDDDSPVQLSEINSPKRSKNEKENKITLSQLKDISVILVEEDDNENEPEQTMLSCIDEADNIIKVNSCPNESLTDISSDEFMEVCVDKMDKNSDDSKLECKELSLSKNKKIEHLNQQKYKIVTKSSSNSNNSKITDFYSKK